MSIEALPAELQARVYSHLDNASLKSLRLVARAMPPHVNGILFRNVIIAPRRNSLDIAALLIPFKKHVRRVVFDGTVYDKNIAASRSLYKDKARALGEPYHFEHRATSDNGLVHTWW